MPRLCWDCLVFPIQANKALKLSINVCECQCAHRPRHAWVYIYTCACTCVYHVCVGSVTMWVHVETRDWHQNVFFNHFSTLIFNYFIFYFYCYLWLFLCVRCMGVSVGTQVLWWRSKDLFPGVCSLLPSWVPGIKLSSSGFYGKLSYAWNHRPTLHQIFWGTVSHGTFVTLAREGDQQVPRACLSLLHSAEVTDIHSLSRLWHFHFNF